MQILILDLGDAGMARGSNHITSWRGLRVGGTTAAHDDGRDGTESDNRAASNRCGTDGGRVATVALALIKILVQVIALAVLAVAAAVPAGTALAGEATAADAAAGDAGEAALTVAGARTAAMVRLEAIVVRLPRSAIVARPLRDASTHFSVLELAPGATLVQRRALVAGRALVAVVGSAR